MKTKRIIPLVVLSIALGACGGRDAAQKDQKEYEVVQEGAASGVTSTIAGPGEAVPPVTGTNADTTTSFTLTPNVGATTTAPGVVAGTIPPPAAAYPAGTQVPPPMTSGSRAVSTPSPAPRVNTSAPAVQRPRRVQPVQTDTTTTYRTDRTDTTDTTDTDVAPPTAAPTQTDTVAPPPVTTTTNPPVKPEEKKKNDGDAEEEEPPPPPPPTTTTTSGVQ